MRFTKFLSKLKILSDTQYGFRHCCPTQDVIISLTEFVYAPINNRKFSSTFFIDYSKAFDAMNHRLLLQKLDPYSIRGVANKLIADYLYIRYQCVKIYGELSTS